MLSDRYLLLPLIGIVEYMPLLVSISGSNAGNPLEFQCWAIRRMRAIDR
jgi:hypothetical protein